MNSKGHHPSYLELDRYALSADRAPGTKTQTHVGQCARCRQYVERVAPSGAGEPAPAWLNELSASHLRSGRRARAPRERWAAAASGLAVAALACLMWWPTPATEPAHDTAKGLPAVAVYVKRDSSVSLWHGAEFEPGDSIRLEVAPDSFEYVSVFLESGAGRQILYQGAVEAHAHSVLPKAWELDAAPTAEQLAVIFSDRSLTPGAAAAVLAPGAADPRQVYVVRMSLPKRLNGY